MKTNLPVTNLLFSYSGYRQHGFAMQMFNNQIQTIQSKYKEISNETVRFGSKTAS
jgi:tRNA U38,U39,U40 pseudouridine synthase TruA